MMLNDQRRGRSGTTHGSSSQEEEPFRDIQALAPYQPPTGRRRDSWETSSHRSSSLSLASSELTPSENFTSMSREFNALVLAGSAIRNTSNNTGENVDNNNLGSIGEDDHMPNEETNPLAIVLDSNPLQEPTSRGSTVVSSSAEVSSHVGEVASIQHVKKKEVELKISAWKNAKITKTNNQFKREDAITNGWESDLVQKASSWMKKIERRLEEKRARALEKMQNDIAKAHQKAEERRATAEAKRGTKVARVLEISNLMRAVGRVPSKTSFF